MSLGSMTKYRTVISLAVLMAIAVPFQKLGAQEESQVYRVKRSGEQASSPGEASLGGVPEPEATSVLPPSNPRGGQEATQQNSEIDCGILGLEPAPPGYVGAGGLPCWVPGETKPPPIAAEEMQLYQWQYNRAEQSRPAQKLIRPEEYLNHEVLDRILRKYVTKSGWVDYRGLQRDKKARENLGFYVEDLCRLNPSTLKDPLDRIAAWLNLYNALVIQEVLKRYPIKNLMEVPNFFGEPRFSIGEEKMSFIDIEKKVFLEQIRDPRTVFARANGASSGPRLLKEAFSPLKIEAQLEDRTWKFLMDRANVDFDLRRRVLTLNQAFLWYQEEFVDLGLFLRTYLDLLPQYAQIFYRGYDWKLNDEKLH